MYYVLPGRTTIMHNDIDRATSINCDYSFGRLTFRRKRTKLKIERIEYDCNICGVASPR